MLLALFALMTGSIPLMLAVLFVTATQAAFFSPAKYGIIPEFVGERDLSRANGLLEMSTFVAIILGTVAGTTLVAEWRGRPALIGAFLIGIAVLGTWTSLRIPHIFATVARRPFPWNPMGEVVQGIGRLRKDSALLQAVTGTTFFWFLGA